MTSLSDMQLLVVDDNQQMRHLLRCLLRAVGVFRITEAETAAEALDAMRERQIDLVILDWKMAPVDGLAFARRLRWSEDSPNPFVPILMLSDAGVTGFVKKPISARLLFERITFALTDTRLFVRAPGFFGPDRRRFNDPGYAGPFRRSTDAQAPEELVDLEDIRIRA